MSTTHLFRQSGFALMGAGLLIGMGMALHPDIADPQAAAQALWAPTHLAVLLGLLLAGFGLTGVFLRQANRAGRLGLAGYALLEIGIVLTAVAISADAFVFPLLSAALLEPAGPLLGGPLGLLLLGASASYILGTLGFGAATLRAGMFARPAAALFTLGGVLVALDPFVPQLVAKLGALLLGIGMLWLGSSLVGRLRAEPLREGAAPAR